MKKGWIYWTPRILSIIFILFLALFSFDIFDSCNSFGSCALGLFMHNLPSLILFIVLIVAWKREIVGGIVFILAGLAYLALIMIGGLRDANFEWYMLSYSFIIAGPAFFIGILFLIGWKRREKEKKMRKNAR